MFDFDISFGFLTARYLVLASFTAFVYDYCLTINDEIKHFWRGPGGAPQVILFFLNRYIPLVASPLFIMTLFEIFSSEKFCKITVRALLGVTLVQMLIAQTILVIRVWFLYSFSPFLQRSTIFAFVVVIIIAIYFTAATANSGQRLHTESHGGCPQLPISWGIWRIYMTAFIFHLLLFVLTTARVLRWRHSPLDDNMRSLSRRLIQDGGFSYFLILLAIGWVGPISVMNSRTPQASIPAMFTPFSQNMISISISHLMLSIRSLAASATFDPPWILNDSELTRVHLSRAARGCDILVEVAASDPLPFLHVTQPPARITTSHVGKAEDSSELETGTSEWCDLRSPDSTDALQMR